MKKVFTVVLFLLGTIFLWAVKSLNRNRKKL